MRHDWWECESVVIHRGGWLWPEVKPEQVDAELDRHGSRGRELVHVADVNGGPGSTAAFVATFERPR